MPSPAPVLLEHLAATGWFAAHGEVALTGGLTFCLRKDPAAAQALMTLIRDRTGYAETDLRTPNDWQAEGVDEHGKRIDVTGWLDTDTKPAPGVLLEAKVSAVFADRQVSTYVESQKRGLEAAGIARGVLVVLVPQGRVQAARDEVASDLERLDVKPRDQGWLSGGTPAVTVIVLSWDEALQTMLTAADRATCDIDQLLGACRALRGADIAAFTEADLAGDWRFRKDDLLLIIDRVTRQATAELSLTLAPWQTRSFAGLDGGYRYLGPADLPNLAVGIRLDAASPPLWVRWHRRTADIGSVQVRLTQAGRQVQNHEGHLWVALEFAPDTGSGTRQIENVASQVVALYKNAVDWGEPI